MSERVKTFAASFDPANVTAETVNNIKRRMWDKMVLLCTSASVTTLMRANVGEIARAVGGPKVMLDMLDLVVTIAEKVGFRPTDEYLDNYRKVLLDTRATFQASMLHDIERGGPTEADHIIDYMLNLADKYGVNAQLLEVSYTNLKAYEQRRAAGRLPVRG